MTDDEQFISGVFVITEDTFNLFCFLCLRGLCLKIKGSKWCVR